MKIKKIHTDLEKLMLFDYKNFEKKVLTNPQKYDKHGFIPLIEKARKEGEKVIKIWRGHIYLADLHIIKSLGAYHEDDEMGSCGWYCCIFLDEETYKNHMQRKEDHFIEQLCLFYDFFLHDQV